MISPEHKQLLSELKTTQHGQALIAYLNERMADISDITLVKDWAETQGKQEAVKLIREIFSFLGDDKFDKKSKNIYI